MYRNQIITDSTVIGPRSKSIKYSIKHLQIFDVVAEKEMLSASDLAKLEVNLSPLLSKSPLNLPQNTFLSFAQSFRAFVTRLETSLGFFILSG